MEHGDADVAAGGEVFEECFRGAAVAVGVEDGFRGEVHGEGGGVGPGDDGDFVAEVGGDVAGGGGAFGGGHDGEVAGFVEEVAGVEEAGFIDEDGAVVEGETGEEGWGGDFGGADCEADAFEEAGDAGGFRLLPHADKIQGTGDARGDFIGGGGGGIWRRARVFA